MSICRESDGSNVNESFTVRLRSLQTHAPLYCTGDDITAMIVKWNVNVKDPATRKKKQFTFNNSVKLQHAVDAALPGHRLQRQP